jgi:2-methylcitrate dehydratase
MKTQVHQLAEFVVRSSWRDLSESAREQLRIRVLDTLGCAVGALDADPVRRCRAHVDEMGGNPQCTLIGGGRSSIEQATFYNGALVRYLDFVDNFLAKGETCHPSDNFAAVLAGCEYARRSGKELMTALATAYQVQVRLTESAPIMRSGFDHTTQLSFSTAAGLAKALGLTVEQTANAIAIGGVDSISLAVIRAEPVSQWKGLASAHTAFGSAQAVMLARRGITGPPGVFEGTQGFMEALGQEFAIEWPCEDLEAVTRTAVKKCNAEAHTQSTLEAALELREAHRIDARDIESVDVEVFKQAYDIVGGGEFGSKESAATKEDADHNLRYLVAVALLDGEVMPAQFAPERINAPDVQQLMRRVNVSPRRTYTWAYPRTVRASVSLRMRDGTELTCEKDDFEGFPTRPMSWERAAEKFEHLTSSNASPALRRHIIAAAKNLESIEVSDLTELLGRVGPQNREQ